jgi:hypothetical protein
MEDHAAVDAENARRRNYVETGREPVTHVAPVKTSALRPNHDPDFIGPDPPFTRARVKQAFGEEEGDDVNH